MHPHHEYNATDVLATRQVLDTLLPIAARRGVVELARAELALEAPLMVMGMRGVRVDVEAAKAMRDELLEEISQCMVEAEERAGMKLSGPKAFSTQKLTGFFFDECRLTGKRSTKEPALVSISKKNRSTKWDNRAKAMEARSKAAFVAERVIEARKAGKLLMVTTARRRQGRLRGSFNVGATETFRLSSSRTPVGDGTNLQNIPKRLRHLFIPDDGFVFLGADQERAESRAVAWLSGDEAYMRAHEEGDTHINVARLFLPGCEAASDEWIQESGARQTAKALQHALNYLEPGAGPETVARLTGQRVERSAELMRLYYRTFPGILRDKERVSQEILETGAVTIGGIRRHLHGRLRDPRTLRKALSHRAQCLSTWTTNVLMVRAFLELDGPDVRLLVHGHDGMLLEVREGLEHEVGARLRELGAIDWPLGTRTLRFPWDIKVGRSWKEVS